LPATWVVGAAEQAELALVVQRQDVGQRRRLEDVTTVGDERFIATLRDAHVAERRPSLACGRAPRCQLTGFGAAVDLDQRPAHFLLGQRGELRRQRRSGAQQQIDLRQFHAG
jgi:hypothetical protein